MSELNQYKTEFLKYLEEKGRKKETLKNYELYLDRFIQEINCSNISQIKTKRIKEFKKWLTNYRDKYGEKIAPNTKNYHLIALRSFLRFLKQDHDQVLDPKKIELIETPQRKINIVKQSDIERLINSPVTKNSGQNKDKNSLRDRAIIEFFLSLGITVSELTSLKKSHINLNRNEINLDRTNISTLPLANPTIKWVQKYLDSRSDNNSFLFISHDNRTKERNKDKPLSDRSIQRLVKKHKRAAGIPYEVTPTILRNTCIVNLADQIKIEQVNYLADHESITATKMYKIAAEEKLKDKQKFYYNYFKEVIKRLTKQ